MRRYCTAPSGRTRPLASQIAGVLLLAFVCLVDQTARGTWSIAAVDPQTREVGIAGASCIDTVEVIAGVAPGRGVIAAQAMVNFDARDRAVELLRQGLVPAEILKQITDSAYDPDSFLSFLSGVSRRQYGIAGLDHRPNQAAFTGDATISWAGSTQAPGVVVQGNMLRSRQVIDDALAAFFPGPRATCSPSLGERLLSALWAGALAGGDRRCVPELAALSAFLEVAAPSDATGSSSLRLVVPLEGESELGLLRFAWRMIVPRDGTAADNPVAKLRTLYADRHAERELGEKPCFFDAGRGDYGRAP